MAPVKKPTKADKSIMKKTPAKKNAVKKASAKRTPSRGLLKEMTKKTPAKKATTLKSGRRLEVVTKKTLSKTKSANGKRKETKKTPTKKMSAKKAPVKKSAKKKEALTKKIASKVKSAKANVGQRRKETKKTPTKKMPAKNAPVKSVKKKEALTKKMPFKVNSAKGKRMTAAGQKKETKKTGGLKNPVIVIKSVDVSPTSSSQKEMPKEEKEMSVEVSSGQQPTSANDDKDAKELPAAKKKKVEKISSASTSKDMASSSTSITTSPHFDLPTFVQSRLAAINSPSVDQELSGSEKATLGDLINHNMQLAHNLYQVGDETILETALVSLLPDFEVEESQAGMSGGISSMAKAAHREVVQYRDLLLLQKVETINEAQRTGWNLAASNLSDTAQVALLVNLLGLAMKLTGIKPSDSVSQAPGGRVSCYSREEVEAYLAIFDSVADEMAEGWKEEDVETNNLPVKRRMLADLTTIIQNF